MNAFILIVGACVAIAGSVLAQNNQDKYFAGESGVAIKGYDVVAYFTDYKAVKGKSDYSVKYDGVTFYFASEEHKNMFIEQPGHYLPEFGGYCAFAMAKMNKKVPTDPETFKIYNGRLYLFFNDMYEGKKFNTIVEWNKEESSLLETANKNWSAIE